MYEQTIYVNEHDSQTITNKFDDANLQQSVYLAKFINDYYIADGYDHWTWLNVLPENIDGEMWRECKNPDYDGCEASNFGRIRKNGKILPQYEEHYPNYTPQQIMHLLISGATNVGWLCVKAGVRGGAQYVYRMVADAWLDYDKTSNKQIHHLSNDGYDNSPYNLIPLDEDTHDKIDHNKSKNDKYPGPKYIKI